MAERGRWVMLMYRLPREPSTPRISTWRKLRRLGVGYLMDGIVALPLDSRNREQLEWVAQEVLEAGGEATIWLAQPATAAQERALATQMAASIAEEYTAVTRAAAEVAEADAPTRRRLLARLRRQMRRIAARDYFPPPERDTARAAVEGLANALEVTL